MKSSNFFVLYKNLQHVSLLICHLFRSNLINSGHTRATAGDGNQSIVQPKPTCLLRLDSSISIDVYVAYKDISHGRVRLRRL